MGELRPWHIIVLVLVVALLFYRRLPDAARALGRSMRIIKAETKGLAGDDVNSKAEAQSGHAPIEGKPVKSDNPDPVDHVRDNT